jgi:hypothetical protein
MRLRLAAIVWVLVAGGVAQAQRPDVTQKTFDGRGNPLLVDNPVPDGSHGINTWRICRPHERCFKPSARHVSDNGRVLEPGPQPAGTRFVARVTYRGRTRAVRTSAWRGRVRARRPARLRGAPSVGATIRPLAARWSGGWGGGWEDLRVEVCRRRTTGCQTLIAPTYVGPSSTPIPERFAGWYVHAADAHVALRTPMPAIGYLRPWGVPVTRRSAEVSWSRPVRIRG